jgi:enamine deaminase RidA (YjgF/YER057c/UK114 family)
MIAGAPEPVAPFSHATEVDGWVFVTGQMPTYPGCIGVTALARGARVEIDFIARRS